MSSFKFTLKIEKNDKSILKFDDEQRKTLQKIKKIYFANDDYVVLNENEELFDQSIAFIIIPNCITAIAEQSFYNFQVHEIHLCQSIKVFDDFCCSHYTNLKKINLENIERIGIGCFYKCTTIKKIKLSYFIKVLPKWCFWKCVQLKKVNLESIEFTGEECFYKCSNLPNKAEIF